MLNVTKTKTKTKEKTPEQMFDIKQKSIAKMADRKLSSMETANVLNAAKDLVIAFPDNWKEKLDDVIACASLIVEIKDDSFLHPVEMLKKLKHGGILSVVDDNRRFRGDYDDHNVPAEPF